MLVFVSLRLQSHSVSDDELSKPILEELVDAPDDTLSYL